ncbi:MAG: hypothetical protein V4627_04250 [Pseudomonadota bacterium]
MQRAHPFLAALLAMLFGSFVCCGGAWATVDPDVRTVKCLPTEVTTHPAFWPDKPAGVTVKCDNGARYLVPGAEKTPYDVAPTAVDPTVARALLNAAKQYNKPLMLQYSTKVLNQDPYQCQRSLPCVVSLEITDQQLAVSGGDQPLLLTSAVCTVGTVGESTNGLTLDCTNLNRGISVFALPAGTEAGIAAQIAKAAKSRSQKLAILYAPDDKSGTGFGCKVADCRPIRSIGFEVDVAAVIKDELEATVVAYTPPRIEPYMAMGRGNTPYSEYMRDNQYVYIKGPAKHYASTLQACTLDVRGAGNGISYHYPPGVLAEGLKTFVYFVSQPSAGYTAAKAAVVDGMVAGLAEIGVPCNGTCRAAIEAGMNAALAAAGLPPSLPNAQAVMEGGAGALAGQTVGLAMSQIPGAPVDAGAMESFMYEAGKEVVREKLQSAIQKGIVQASQRAICPKGVNPDGVSCKAKKDDPVTWGTLDTLLQPFPATAYVHIKPRKGVVSAKLKRVHIQVLVEGAEFIADQPSYALDYLPAEGVVLPVVLWPRINNQALRASINTQDGSPGAKQLANWAQSNLGNRMENVYNTHFDFVPKDRFPLPAYSAAKPMTLRVNGFAGIGNQPGQASASLAQKPVNAGAAFALGGQVYGMQPHPLCNFNAR